MSRAVMQQAYTLSEENVNDLLGWLRAGQINRAVIALEHLNPAELAQPVQPDPLFTAPVAAKKWAALQAEGYKMQHLCFVRDGVTGTIDDWGKVLWEPVQQEPAVKAFEYVNTAAGLRFTKPEYINGVQHPVGTLFYTSPKRQPLSVLMITTAYEQGVGKGHQAFKRSEEIDNPYTPGECREAWQLGYKEGKNQAKSAAQQTVQNAKDTALLNFLSQRGNVVIVSDDENNSWSVKLLCGVDSEGDQIVTTYEGVTLRSAIEAAHDIKGTK